MTELSFPELRARDGLAFDGPLDSPWVSVSDKGVIIKVRYSAELSALIRSIPHGRWNSSAKQWEFSFLAIPDIRAKLDRINTLAEVACEKAEAEDARRAAAKKARQAEIEAHRKRTQPAPMRAEYLSESVDKPIYTLMLEAIGDNDTRGPAFVALPPRHWVAQILGIDQRQRWIRAFLRGSRNYESANANGSRGIYISYVLREGPIFEISSPITWRNTDRYFAHITSGDLVRLTREQVMLCLAR